jgi:hypothetical protein
VISQGLTTYANLLSQVIRNNPLDNLTGLLHRPDVQTYLNHALASGQQTALYAVQQAWNASGMAGLGVTRQALLADVDRAYARAPQAIATAAITAFGSIPGQHFIQGVSTPGANPEREVAAQRAQAVAEAVRHTGDGIALRNGLSIDVAGVRGRAEAVAAQAALRQQQTGEELGLRWRNSLVNPERTCPFCKALNGKVIPVGGSGEFPHPQQIGHHKPPRLYLGILPGPPLHPHCRCWLEIVVLSEPPPLPETPAAQAPAPVMVTSTQVQAMPEQRYNSLMSFLRAAVHELGQILRRIVGLD